MFEYLRGSLDRPIPQAIQTGQAMAHSYHAPPHRLVIHDLIVRVMSDSHAVHSLRTDCAHSHRRAGPAVPVGAGWVPRGAGLLQGPSVGASDTPGARASARTRRAR